MPTTNISNGFSPLSDRARTTPDSSPGPSPQRHYLQDSHTVEAVALGGFAARACEKCRASKRKCDKKLPFCDRCKRLNAKCHYVQDISNNVNHPSAQFIIYQPRSLSSDVLLRGPEPLEGITPSQILSLVPISGLGNPPADWRFFINAYFFCIHPWFAVVHPTLFQQQVGSLLAAADSPSQSDTPASLSKSPVEPHLPAPTATTGNVSYQMGSDVQAKELALLVVAMYLNTRLRMTDAGEQPIFDETYRTVKRLLSSLLLSCVGDPGPSVERVQCGALLALYEYGHGEAAAAYQTLSQTVATARILDIKPGDISDGGDDDVMMLSIEEEQSGCLWWGMFILDQFIHQDEGVKDLPFLLESPSTNTLLPETPPMTPILSSSSNAMLGHSGGGGGADGSLPPSPPPATATTPRYLSTGAATIGTQKLGGFQLSAKTSCLFHRALRIDKERDARPGKMPLVAAYADLDAEIRRATLALLGQTLDWEATLDCFAMLHHLPQQPQPQPQPQLVFPDLGRRRRRAGVERGAVDGGGGAAVRVPDVDRHILQGQRRLRPRAALPRAAVRARGEHVLLRHPGLRQPVPLLPRRARRVPGQHRREVREPEAVQLSLGDCRATEKMMSRLEKKIGLDRSHYLKDSVLTPPPHRLIFDFDSR
ncbi:hypothetical protein F4820DRAFT_460725 [Hypoxylon rubiginosum]|uniref:Uncharacterized protein n=1 Tax=Hypoxylon rubiginosum TaxID=110542 RepID=A0ACB9YQR9_9PEZI|nr:hypothetical protein F4820DRAFT_460725 [Hypoxylon rubiginosum]